MIATRLSDGRFECGKARGMAAKQRAAELLDDDPGWNFVVDLETTGLVDDGAYITEIAIADLTVRLPKMSSGQVKSWFGLPGPGRGGFG
jgi:hypothetical protein